MRPFIISKMGMQALRSEIFKMDKRYRLFLVFTEPSDNMYELLTSIAKTVTQYSDQVKKPYYFVKMQKLTTVKEMQNMIGCDDIRGVNILSTNEADMTRSNIQLAKMEHESLIKKGKMITDILNEDNTSEDILLPADRRAVKAYKKSLKWTKDFCKDILNI